MARHISIESDLVSSLGRAAVNVLGSVHLASAITLAGVNAALSQANFRRPPARRLLRSRH